MKIPRPGKGEYMRKSRAGVEHLPDLRVRKDVRDRTPKVPRPQKANLKRQTARYKRTNLKRTQGGGENKPGEEMKEVALGPHLGGKKKGTKNFPAVSSCLNKPESRVLRKRGQGPKIKRGAQESSLSRGIPQP